MSAPAVAFDVTHAQLNRTGLGRYPAELRPHLARRVRLLPVSAVNRPAGGAARRIARGVLREAVYYPWGLSARARAAGANVVHSPTPAPVRGGGLPLVVTVHDLLPLRHPELFTSETRAHTRLSLPFVRRADRVLTNSEWTRGEVIDLLGLPPERVATTPFGVAERFRPDPAAHDRVRERHGVAGPYVLCVGTREPRKNLVAALRAFERLARRRPDVELVLAGGRGWHGEELERALAAVSDRVRTPGFVSDAELVDLYAAAACFVFPSLAEGFGFPVLEAMACGAPVVTSDNSALREVAGDAALLVDPHSSEAIAEALERVLEDPELRDDLRRRGLERRRAFTWEACADATVAAYRDLLDEHS